MRGRHHSAPGFSLIELIVAMAIFLVLLGGLGALYSNALRTVVSGYQQQEGFEKARASLKVLERDLNMAFTSRDHGDAYDFFGAREGFAFVGLLSGGQIGRVTYALHPTADSKEFTTSFGALYRDLHRLALDQNFPVADLQAIIADQFPLGTPLPGQNDLVPVPNVGDPNNNPYDEPPWSTLIEFEQIIVRTGAIVRYEESINNLDVFPVAKPGATNPALPASYYTWPRVALSPGSTDEPGDSGPINNFVYLAIDPQGSLDPPVSSLDLRALYNANQGFLSRLDRGVFESIVRARKRDAWIQLVSSNLPVNDAGTEFFWGNGGDLRPVAAQYVLVEDIVLGAFVPELPAFNVIDIPSPFAYKPDQDPESGDWWGVFNGLGSLPGFNQYVIDVRNAGDNAAEDQAIRDFDLALVETAGASDTEVGTPIAPKLPSYVRVQFWVALRPKYTASREFRRWFVEEFVVPSAIGRGTVATLTRRERT
jgi:prepilin-type N-terminal cleavage/methylation domain-containing protein